MDTFPETPFVTRIQHLGRTSPHHPDNQVQFWSDMRMPASVADQRTHALAYLRGTVFDYLDKGSYNRATGWTADNGWSAVILSSVMQDMSDLSDHLLGVTMGEPVMTLDRALMYTAARIGGPEARRIEFDTTPGAERDNALETLIALNRPTGR